MAKIREYSREEMKRIPMVPFHQMKDQCAGAVVGMMGFGDCRAVVSKVLTTDGEGAFTIKVLGVFRPARKTELDAV